jgi:hypothetical protein
MADVKARVQAAIAAREAAVKGAATSVPSPTAPMEASRYRVRQTVLQGVLVGSGGSACTAAGPIWRQLVCSLAAGVSCMAAQRRVCSTQPAVPVAMLLLAS